MPAHCAVVNCSDKYVHHGSISFHRFPFKRKDLLQKWKDFTQRSAQWIPSKWSAVCSRHFRDSDFNCSNNRKTLKKCAVPTLRVAVDEPETLNVVVQQVTNGMWQMSSKQPQTEPAKQTLSLSSAAEPPNSSSKSTCRFCGVAALNCVSFDNSFEVFGMIQKCFPTLQILQDDTLPKDICNECYKQLERFSKFIDVVLLTQSELQRKYRRQLKIKQEPLVRVKQEACESLDNLFPDELDMGMDDGCEHEPCTNDETEQKFQFCDFPMLNAQDIINNCDIMEIINLDDPFINITDDADVVQSQASQPVNAAVLPTASEMLQAELLTEEHNYAKEDWQLPPHQYKTEKLEASEPEQSQTATLATTNSNMDTVPEPRSSKPIVTNVSQIPNPMLCELLPKVTPPAAASTVPNSGHISCQKPNIVVLNDSVVQSSAAFRLHNCNLCLAKFFTADSLNVHYSHSHAAPAPMVSVPPLNVSLANSVGNVCAPKLESSALSLAAESSAPTVTTQTDYWQPEWMPNLPLAMPAPFPKKKIDILDMQRSFLHHNDLMPKLDSLATTQAPQLTSLIGSSTPPPVAADPQLVAVTANYAKLAARFQRLQRKCRKLKYSRSANKSKAARHRCAQCSQGFRSMQQLLHHRRLKRHFVVKPCQFVGKCCGCSKFFRSRIALRQHMRYICQSLPLRSTRLQSFKCRHCQAITFTHWRLYRRHELKCRSRRVQQLPLPKPKRTSRRRAIQATNNCNVCQKSFSSLTGLNQHRITHSTERRYKCGICARVFKRRNGLSQHIKGYHLQLKPHECPVCKHRYALKCDMLRCRHSQRRAGAE